MRCICRPSCALAIALVVGHGSNVAGQTVETSTKVTASRLGNWLIEHGYVEVSLSKNKTGHLDVKVDANGTAMLLALDTGANNINLDRASADRAKLNTKDVTEKTAALGGVVSTGLTRMERFTVGTWTASWQAYVVDFKPTNDSRNKSGDPPCDGVLGGSYLFENSAIIDYARRKLYLLDPAKDARDVSELMTQSGYLEIPLTLNSLRILDVPVKLGDTSMLLFLDTGFCSPVGLDWTSARAAKLVITQNKVQTSELGGAAKTGEAKVDRLTVGRLTRPANIHVNDFTATHGNRKKNNLPLADGNLGGPFFETYSAVIDYGKQKLYLLDRPEQ